MSRKAEIKALIAAAKAGVIPPNMLSGGFPDMHLLRKAIAGDITAALELRQRLAGNVRWSAIPGATGGRVRVSFPWVNGVDDGEADSFERAMALAVLNYWSSKQ